MSNLIETIPYKGYEIKVYYDDDAQSPDDWENEDAFLVYDHRDFTVKREGFDPFDIFEAMRQERPMELFDGYYYFPVYAYIHSGVALKLGSGDGFPDRQWDVSFKGFALVQHDEKNGWTTKEKAREVAQAIVDEWNMYLSGDVYGYDSGVDSCWGFYGDEGRKEMISEAKGEIDYEVNKKFKRHFAKVKAWIRNKVPLTKRFPLPTF